MPAPPQPGTVVVPSKKLSKKDAFTLAPLADGRLVITAVKKGLPKEIAPGRILKSIAVEGQQVADAASLAQAEEQRKAATKAGKTVLLSIDGVTATGKKPSKDSKVGLSLRREADVGIVVRKIEEDGIFSKTPLAVGQIITSINKVPCPKETKDVIEMLKAAKKELCLTAVDRAADAPAEEEPAEPAPEAAPEAEPAPSKDESPAEPVTPEPSEDEADKEPAPEKDDASDKAPVPELKPSESQDEDETAKDDSDDASSVGKDRGTAKAEESTAEPSEEKKTDEAGSNWLCCAY